MKLRFWNGDIPLIPKLFGITQQSNYKLWWIDSWFFNYSSLILLVFIVTIIFLIGLFLPKTPKGVSVLNVLSACGIILFLFLLPLPHYNFFKTLVWFDYSAYVYLYILLGGLFTASFLAINNEVTFLKENRHIEYPLLILLIFFFGIIVVGSENFIAVFLALEAITLMSAVLIGFQRTNSLSTLAGVRYIFFSAIPGGALILGISEIYAYTGTFNFSDIEKLLLNYDLGDLNNTKFVGTVLYDDLDVAVLDKYDQLYQTHYWQASKVMFRSQQVLHIQDEIRDILNISLSDGCLKQVADFYVDSFNRKEEDFIAGFSGTIAKQTSKNGIDTDLNIQTGKYIMHRFTKLITTRVHTLEDNVFPLVLHESHEILPYNLLLETNHLVVKNHLVNLGVHDNYWRYYVLTMADFNVQVFADAKVLIYSFGVETAGKNYELIAELSEKLDVMKSKLASLEQSIFSTKANLKPIDIQKYILNKDDYSDILNKYLDCNAEIKALTKSLEEENNNPSALTFPYMVTSLNLDDFAAVLKKNLIFDIDSLTTDYRIKKYTKNNVLDLVFYKHTYVMPQIIKISLLLIVIYILFKLTAAPFQIWAPPIYEGAPLPMTIFLSIFSKITMVFLLIKLLIFYFYFIYLDWSYVLLFSGILSIVAGIYGAIAETRIKRFFVYSSMGHVGFMLLGIAEGGLHGTVATIVYLIIYTITVFIGWTTLFSSMKKITHINQLSGVAKNNPTLGFIIAISMLSMSGIPPLAGFFVKFEILYALVESDFYNVNLIALFLTVLSFFYYLRIIKIIYFEPTKNNKLQFQFNKTQASMLTICFLILVNFVLYCQQPIYFLIKNIILQNII